MSSGELSPRTIDDADLSRRIAAWPAAAFVIVPSRARITRANAAGRQLFGVPYRDAGSDSAGVSLDSAMPAVRRLRALAETGVLPAEPTALTFWTMRGKESLECRITRLDVEETPETARYLVMAEPAKREAPAVAPTEPGPVRTDAETLREIARRIREGRATTIRVEPDPAGAEAAAGQNDARGEVPPSPEPTPEPAAEATNSEAPREAAANENAPGQAGADIPPRTAVDLAKLAHELKTPLSAIAAAADIMKQGRFGAIGNEKYAGYVADMHANALHALSVIDRMLDRRDSSKSANPLSFQRLSLNAIVGSCVSSIAPLAEAKGIELTACYAPGDPSVTADETSLRQILLNVLTNALKFTPAKGRIAVTTEATAKGPTLVRVRDTGAGMSALAIAEALKPLEAVVPGERVGGGQGFGLPIARALSEANGAALLIESKPGAGTEVRVRFPRRRLVAI